jgi:hypothetical protein
MTRRLGLALCGVVLALAGAAVPATACDDDSCLVVTSIVSAERHDDRLTITLRLLNRGILPLHFRKGELWRGLDSGTRVTSRDGAVLTVSAKPRNESITLVPSRADVVRYDVKLTNRHDAAYVRVRTVVTISETGELVALIAPATRVHETTARR